jgi:hypothetical protein
LVRRVDLIYSLIPEEFSGETSSHFSGPSKHCQPSIWPKLDAPLPEMAGGSFYEFWAKSPYVNIINVGAAYLFYFGATTDFLTATSIQRLRLRLFSFA